MNVNICPRVSLKRDGTVVVNTGNLLHSFSVQLETLGSGAKDQELGGAQQQVCSGKNCLSEKLHTHPPFIPWYRRISSINSL